MINDRERIVKTIKEKKPLIAAIVGTVTASLALKSAVIRPETIMAASYMAVWSCVLLRESLSSILKDSSSVMNNELQRIESMFILCVYYILSVLPRLKGISNSYINVGNSTVILCLLCVISVLFEASGDIKSAKVVVYGIMVIEVNRMLLYPLADWDLIACSLEVLRRLQIAKLIIPIYMLSIMPGEQMDDLLSGIKAKCRITGINVISLPISKDSMKRTRIVHVLICLSSVLLFLCSNEKISGSFFNIPISIIFVIVISELLECPHYNGIAVALPVFMKLIYDFRSNGLIIHSDHYELYLVIGSIALFAAIRAKKGLFLYSESIGALVIIIDVLSYCADLDSLNASGFSRVLSLYGAEIMLYISFLMYGKGGTWSERIVDDIKSFLFQPDEDSLDGG